MAHTTSRIVAVYDAKSYDRDSLGHTPGADQLNWRFLDFRLSLDTVRAAEGAVAACIFVSDQADEPILKKLRSMGIRLLALRCTGFNMVDIAVARELGMEVCRVPNYSPYAVAEHTVALILALNRKIHRAYNRVRELNFSVAGLEGVDLHGKTAGILGSGKIGRVVAQILRGFGMRVLAYDPYPQPEWAARAGVDYVELEALLRESDIVSLHVPLTPDTKHIIRRETVELLKPGAIVVNVSRGKLIDTTALIDGLKRRRIGGVALDVYEEEEGVFFEDLSGQVLQDDELARLLTFPNVLITAHQAFLTREALADIARVTVENIRLYISGQALLDGTAVT